MSTGAPRVDPAALAELDQLLIDISLNKRSPIDAAIVQEERDEESQSTARDTGSPTAESVVRPQVFGRIEFPRKGQGKDTAGANPDAGGGPRRRGA